MEYKKGREIENIEDFDVFEIQYLLKRRTMDFRWSYLAGCPQMSL